MKIIISFLFVLLLSSQLSAIHHEVPADSAPNYDDAVLTSQSDYTVKNWMSAPSFKNKNIADLTLPGTHNSGTYRYKTAIAGKCQTLSISEQLEAGVRYLDLRVRVDKNRVPGIYHGASGYANLTLRQVLLSVRNYIHKYKSEAVILCIDDEKDKGASVIGPIEQLLEHPDFKEYVYNEPVIPKLENVRGKMIYWRRYGNFGVGPGLRIQIKRIGSTSLYHGATLFTQDKYKETGNNKFRIVCNSLEDASKGAGDRAGNINQYLSFTSYYNVIPNPCPDGRRMNEKVGKWVVDKQRANKGWPINFGIVASDGVDRRYIYNILCTNFLRTDYREHMKEEHKHD